jgi:ABC-type transport system substrate-binding protein
MIQPSRHRAVRLSAAILLAVSVLMPAAVPAAAADPGVLTVGTTQDLDATNPFNTELVVGYEAFQLTYNLLVEFDKDSRPAEGFADTWTRAADRVTFHIRDGMQWSDGTPATSKDVCYSWGLGMAAIADGANVGVGYLDPNIKDAGVTKIECPDASTFVAYTTDQSERIFQVYMPILPEHIYGTIDYKKIGDEKFDGPLVGTGPYLLQEWKTGQFARFTRNPNFWGKQGFADEVVLRFFPDNTDVMVQALKSGELDYAHGVNSDQYKQLQAPRSRRSKARHGWSSCVQHLRHRDRQDDQGGGPSAGTAGPNSETPRWRDTRRWWTASWAGSRCRHHDRPPCSSTGTSGGQPRTFDIRLAKRARRRRLKLDASPASDSTRKASDQPAARLSN